MKRTTLIFAVVSVLGVAAISASAQEANSKTTGLSQEPLAGKANQIPVPAAAPTISISPVILPSPGRPVPLQIRVTAPVTGKNLPVIILSHGHGNSNNLSSLNGYAPLADFWAAHGFLVIQPTHLDSKALKMNPMGPGGPFFWRSRAQDIRQILDQLDLIEKAFPELKGRMDKGKIAVAGHSLGGFTASLLLGEEITDAKGEKINLADKRVKAGLLLSAPGNGGADLNPMMSKVFADYRPDFTTMTTPTLIIAGSNDVSAQETIRGADWHTDPYKFSTGAKCLITLSGGEHNLGGISGYDAAEAKDESPERVALVQRLSWAYIWSALHEGDQAWQKATLAFNQMNELGILSCK